MNNIVNPLAGGAVAVLLLASAELAFIFGGLGILSNQYITLAILSAPLVTIAIVTFHNTRSASFADFAFFTLLSAIVTSWALNPWLSDQREAVLLLITLFAYPACRSLNMKQIAQLVNITGVLAGILTALGAAFTGVALWKQWDDSHGHVFVFGSNAAPTNFSYCLGFFLIFATAYAQTVKRALLICAFISIPIAIFAASLVRFTFIAIIGVLIVDIFLSKTRSQRFVNLALISTIIIAACIGFGLRSDKSKLLIAYTAEAISGNTQNLPLTSEPKQDVEVAHIRDLDNIKPKLTSCETGIDFNNSLSIRRATILDSFALIPLAGSFGFGLDSFLSMTCANAQVHVSILQAAVEFGWFGGAAFLVIIFYVGMRIFCVARLSGSGRFLTLAFLYLLALSMVYGRFSREYALFALLGVSVSLIEAQRRQKKSRKF